MEQAGQAGLVLETWAPYIRTTFVKLTLKYQEGAPLAEVQTRVIAAIKALTYRSPLQGSEGAELWCTKPRPVEERLKIRALVMCKEFVEKLGERATKRHEMPEIDWRGRLYVGNIQLVGSCDRNDPAPEDQFVADNKGNH